MAPLGIALPVAAVFACCVYLHDLFDLPTNVVMPLGIGWLLAGTTCWILGRIWNRDQAFDRFLGFRVEYWGLFYFIPGVVMLLPILLINYDTAAKLEPGALG